MSVPTDTLCRQERVKLAGVGQRMASHSQPVLQESLCGTVSLHSLTDCVGKCSSAPHVLPTGHLQRMCAGYCTKGVELTAATPARPAERIHKLMHT